MDKREQDLLNRIQELEVLLANSKAENERLTNLVEDYQRKEQSISSAIISSMEHANQLEASRKKLYLLDLQRSRLMYFRMEQIINELYRKYPELKKDSKLKDMADKFKSMLYNDLNKKNKDTTLYDSRKNALADDPIKKLLHNIISCFESKKPLTPPTIIPPTSPTSEKTEKATSTNGFNLSEALHPTMELDEIMKAFNLDDKTDNKK